MTTQQKLYSEAWTAFAWVETDGHVLEVNPQAAATAWLKEHPGLSVAKATREAIIAHAKRFPICDID